VRRLAPLALVLVACTGTAEEPTTTTPLTELSTTSSTAAVITTAEPTTMTTAEECTERGGVPRDPQGFVCPPGLLPSERWLNPTYLVGYRAGTYATQLFHPAFTFTAPASFQSHGESGEFVELFHGPIPTDSDAPRVVMRAWSSQSADPVRSIIDSPPMERPTTESDGAEVIVAGRQATRVDVACTDGDPNCFVSGINGSPLIYGDGQRVILLDVDTPEAPLLLEVSADPDLLDDSWADTV
jgi:hypothetical protein